MWIGSGGCSNFSSTILSRPALIGLRRLIGQHPRQAAALLGILDRGVGAVGGEPRRARHADLAAVFDKAPVQRRDQAPNWIVSCECDRRRRLRLAAPLEIG